MESNQLLNSTELVIAFVALLFFGFGYNLGIEKWRWLAQLRPAEQVVIGVLITVLTSGFFIGWMNAIIVIGCFAGSGLPMLLGSWNRAGRDAAEAKRVTKESLK